MSLLAQDERLARRVGAATLAVLAAAILFVVFVWDEIEWGRRLRVTVVMRSSGGLQEGAPLIVAGSEVGTIESIRRSPHGVPGPLGGEEGVLIRVAIEARHAGRLVRGADVFVASRGVLSARYLELGPMPADGEPLGDGDVLRGADPPTLDRVLQRTWDNLMTAREFAEAVRPELDTLRVRIAELEANLDATLATSSSSAPAVAVAAGALGLMAEVDALVTEAGATRTALGGDAGLARIEAIVDETRSTLARASTTIAALRPSIDRLGSATSAARARLGERGPRAVAAIEQAIDRGRKAIALVEPLLAKVREVRDRLRRGEGSMGRLMTDPEFPEDAKELGKILKRTPWRVIAKPKDE